jgi:hypothetical protein
MSELPPACPAIAIATEALNEADRANRRIKYGRVWTALGVAALGAAGVCLGALITNVPSVRATEVATRVATNIAGQVSRDEIRKAQKTTEDISYAAAKLGSNDSLQAFYASLSTAPIVKPKSAPAKQ